ncbi:hypothetical protein [Caldanaerobacter sp.]|uniref:hypothetical protein n=1 Tax=Caldanaerobacter sp. TaxID=2930036 RepID=UPI003C721AAB
MESEAFGFDVKWEQETYIVKINFPAREMSVKPDKGDGSFCPDFRTKGTVPFV